MVKKNSYFSDLKKAEAEAKEKEVVVEEKKIDQLMFHKHDPILFSNMQNFWRRAEADKREFQSRKIIHNSR